MATINRAKLLESLAEHVPDFDAKTTLAVQIHPTYVTADVLQGPTQDSKCWKPGCLERGRHSHPKRWEVK